MKRTVLTCISAVGMVSSVHAATTAMSAAPSESWIITDYCKQDVYDPHRSKIGSVDDVLVDKSCKVTGLVIGVSGFLGLDEKDVIVPFAAVKSEKKRDKWWLTLDETKDSLEGAPGFEYSKAWERPKAVKC